MSITIQKIRNIVITLVIIGFFVFRYFIYWDIPNNCRITIIPALTEFSNSNIQRALRVLKQATPEAYANVCAHVKTISPNIGCGGFGGGCYYEAEPETIYISTSQTDLIGAAAVIVHETCHVIQGQQGRIFNENECYEADDIIFRELSVYE